MNLQLEAENDNDGVNAIRSTFQVARVTRPLMSVSKICDADMTCEFNKVRAVVRDKNGKVVCVFHRRGGLYVAKMKLKNGSRFQRQGH